MLIIYVYFGLPLFLGIDPRTFTNFKAGAISLTVFHTAFMAEVFRTGLTAVAPGQREAALSLGMGRFRAFTSITLPQAIRIAVPTWGNDFVGMVKDTSLVGVIGIFELYRTGQDMVSDTFKPFEVWTGITILYIGIVVVIDILVRLTERRLRPGTRARGPVARRRAAEIDAIVRGVSLSGPAPLPGDPNQPNNPMKEPMVRREAHDGPQRPRRRIVGGRRMGRRARCRPRRQQIRAAHRRPPTAADRCSTRSSNGASSVLG